MASDAVSGRGLVGLGAGEKRPSALLNQSVCFPYDVARIRRIFAEYGGFEAIENKEQ